MYLINCAKTPLCCGHTRCLLMAKDNKIPKTKNKGKKAKTCSWVFTLMQCIRPVNLLQVDCATYHHLFIMPHIAAPFISFFFNSFTSFTITLFPSSVILDPACLSILTKNKNKHRNDSTLSHWVTQNVQPRVRPRFKDTSSIQQPPSPPSSLQERPLHTHTPGRFRGRLSWLSHYDSHRAKGCSLGKYPPRLWGCTACSPRL